MRNGEGEEGETEERKKIYGAGRLVPCRRVFVIIVNGKKVATCTYIHIYIYLSVI